MKNIKNIAVVISVFSILSFLLPGCFSNNNKGKSKNEDSAKKTAEKNLEGTKKNEPSDPEELPPPPPEGRELIAFDNGKQIKMFESQARNKGYTVIDLSNYWVPFMFSEKTKVDDERKANEYRKIYRKLENDWPYDSPSVMAAKKIREAQHKRVLNAKIAQLREEGVSEEDIKERLHITDDSKQEEEAETDSNNSGKNTVKKETNPDYSGAGEANHYLEVYGIPPSLSVLKKRAEDELDKPCFKEINYDIIKNFDGFIAYRSNDQAKADARRGRSFVKKMHKEMERLGVTDSLKLIENKDNKLSKKLIEVALGYEALVEAQKQLVCEGLYKGTTAKSYYTGGLDWKTHEALALFEKKNRIFGWGYFGKDTVEALGKTPQARMYDSFLRVLAERIVDATHIIEDGSAKDENGEKATYINEKGEKVPVPNLVAQYSAIVLREMNLTTPDKVVDFLKSFDDKKLDTLFVGIKLPKKPPYYAPDMNLHAVINRGDVWYEYPYTKEFAKKGQPRKHMPMTTLYTNWNGQDIPLVRMHTTIGSWRTEMAPDGNEYFKYKNSDVGPRVWRKIIAGPVWMPPDGTPGSDLIKKISYKHNTYEVPNYTEFGPGYASAYGLVAAFHERQVENKDGTFRYLDNGIRSHGSVDYNSILRRYSHGCHRLYNHLAIRIFDFVLRHKPFNRVGQIPAGYGRTVENEEGDTFNIKLDTRGYQYELLEPVPVMVQKGNIRGRQKTPIEGYMPKPDEEYDTDAQFLPEEFKFLQYPSDTDSSTDTDSEKDTDSVTQVKTDTAKEKKSDTDKKTDVTDK